MKNRTRGRLLAGVLWALFGTSVISALQPAWYESYKEAVREIESTTYHDNQGKDWDSVIDMLEKAIRADSRPSRRKKVQGVFGESYFPHYYLGLAYLRSGCLDKAKESLQESKYLYKDLEARRKQYECVSSFGLGQTPGNGRVYMPRGDRCEGILEDGKDADFAWPRAKRQILNLVSFTADLPDDILNDEIAHESLRLLWPRNLADAASQVGKPGPKPQSKCEVRMFDTDGTPVIEGIRLQVLSLRPELSYRMETIRPRSRNSFEWRMVALEAPALSWSELGLVAWLPDETGESILLPITLPVQTGRPNHHYMMVLIPTRELGEVYVSLYQEHNGEKSPTDTTEEAVGYGYYPADLPMHIRLKSQRDPGFYYVKIGATLRSGGSTVTSFRFYQLAR